MIQPVPDRLPTDLFIGGFEQTSERLTVWPWLLTYAPLSVALAQDRLRETLNI
jgi:hypothetical protein